ncbi:hypothetical protein BJ742DRAFT_529300 [Cladochytrium replicatum]|nr:hypothetical protein BJ742DRAFT_529300 [Cladochytrium replicatum]
MSASKRRSEEEISLPPNKRRTLAVAPSLSEEDPSYGFPNIDSTPPEESDPLATFQKYAIWKQMQEYKRFWERAAAELSQSRDREKISQKTIVYINGTLVKVEEYLSKTASTLDNDHRPPTTTGQQQPRLLQLLLSPIPDFDEIDESVQKTLNAINTQLSSVINMALAFRSSNPANGSSASNTSFKVDTAQSKIDTAQARCQELEMQISQLNGKVTMLKRKYSELEDRHEVTQEQLISAERKLDRLKVSHWAGNGGLTSSNNPPAATDGGDSMAITSGNVNGPVATPTVDVPALVNGSPQHVDEDLVALAAARLVEIEELRNDRIRQQGEIDQLRMSLANIPDERIKDSPFYKNLHADWNYFYGENEILKAKNEKLLKELEALNAERRKLTETIEGEEGNRRRTMETEMRKLEADLTRLRNARDNLQQTLDLRCGKDEMELARDKEIRVIANARKDRIRCLEMECGRLKTGIAAMLGDVELLRLLDEDTSEKESEGYDLDGERLTSFQAMYSRFKKSQEKIQELEMTISAYREASEDMRDRQDLINATTLLESQLERAKENIRKLEKLYGLETKNDEADDGLADPSDELDIDELRDRVKKLGAIVRARVDEITRLKVEISQHEKTRSRLISEVENISKSWEELQNQNSKKVLDLSEKDDQILRLVAEKTKYDQKCAILTKEKTTINNLMIAQKRLSDKQLEQIRKLEDREKTLNQQLQATEKELALRNTAFELQKRSVADQLHQITGLKDQLDKSGFKFVEVNNLLRDRTRALEAEIDQRRRLGEQMEALKRKIETLGNKEAAGDAQLQRQLEEYKHLLKCPSCNNNFKSHTILRCMHVFCEDCITRVISSRQRKCPTCAIGFGQGDVKQVYL